MSRYIDADILLAQVIKKKPETAKVRWTEGFNDAIMRVRSMIVTAPTADVVEVRHGEWLDTGDRELDTIYSGYKCSVCGFIICGHSGKYCSECGAKMDGERSDK